ncbi:MAG: signal recognition particle protein [Alphaproteobacteria bacterium]|nr:signal recognition particle protein [Alphaproteobacteria bacterium]
MFDNLTDKFNTIFAKLTSRGVLGEKEIDEAMREIRIALLEADVSLAVAKEFIAEVKTQALGEKVIKSVTPGQMVVKIVHDELVKLLGEEEDTSLSFNAVPPVCLMMVGLQGSGKTTTSAKIAAKLIKARKKVMLASLDIYRPAAQEQLAQLGKQIEVYALPIVKGEKPVEITKRAIAEGKKGSFDVIILDTAGRLQIDEDLMKELDKVKEVANPTEILLVADSMIGQEACNVAQTFNERLGITGLVLTRIDGTSRAGAALSMKKVTNVPIKFLGTGEKIDEFEEFHADRIAGRILGKGDVVSLVEKAIENVDKEDAEKLAEKMMKGKFDLEDMLGQLKQMQKLGSIGGIMGMLPGMAKFKNQIEQMDGDKIIKRQEAIILSMTKKERKNPDIIKASRKKRIAAGSGVEVHEVNKLLKSYDQMSEMMKRMKKMGGMGAMAKMMMGGMGSGNPLGGLMGGMGGKRPF